MRLEDVRVGDILMLEDNEHMCAEVGSLARVLAVRGKYVDVEWIRGTGCKDQSNGGYDPETFSLFNREVELKIAGYNVTVKKNGESLQVGCSEVTFEQIEKLYKLMKQRRKQ